MARICQRSRIWFYSRVSDCELVSGKPWASQPVLLKGLGKIEFGSGVRIGYYPSPYFFNTCCYLEARNPSASIVIGDGVTINNNCAILAEQRSIIIGRGVVMGTNVTIMDSDFHGLAPEERHEVAAAASGDVVIADDCFLGSNVKVMKGVTIGEGSVIGNGSVVTSDVPARAIAAGNPARVIRSVSQN